MARRKKTKRTVQIRQMPARRPPRGIGPILIVIVAAIWAAMTLFDVGLTWDESIYTGFIWSSYRPWFSALVKGGAPSSLFSAGALFRAWELGQVHPPLAKLTMGLTTFMFLNSLPIYIAMRLASVFWYVVALLSVYKLTSDGAGRRSAIFATAALAVMPRFFGHAHIAALDMPVAALWAATAALVRPSLKKPVNCLGLGVVFGLALLTKINAVFIPFAVIPWLLLFGRRRSLLPIAALVVLGPLVFCIGWPALWHNPVLGIARYFVDKLGYSSAMLNPAYIHGDPTGWLIRSMCELLKPSGRSVIPVLYLGKVYGSPPAPWHYPIVMSAVTVPLGMLLVAAVAFLRKPIQMCKRPFLIFIVMNLAMTMAPFLAPQIGKYDGVRLFLPAMPFIAVLFGLGFSRLTEVFKRVLGPKRSAAGRCAVGAFWAWHILLLVWLHPYYLSFYGGLTGGIWGAKRLGFETTYWTDTLTNDALRVTSGACKAGDKILIGPTGGFVPIQLQKIYGLLPENVEVTADQAVGDWDYFIMIPRQGMFKPWMRELYETGTPVWERRIMGVPQCLIFEREKAN